MKITKRVVVHGRVQGVNFREATRLQAQRCNVGGWVRNCDDGSVEALLHGLPDDVARVLDWMRRGPPAARVARMEVGDSDGEFDGFERR
ncbi:MAG TPA: acylphosphatase [Burkholderiales bacterium]|nr:acylphosphatase [Burkholderiales bacterium]